MQKIDLVKNNNNELPLIALNEPIMKINCDKNANSDDVVVGLGWQNYALNSSPLSLAYKRTMQILVN